MSENSDFFIKSMPLDEWRAIQAELTQLREMKAAIDALAAIPVRLQIELLHEFPSVSVFHKHKRPVEADELKVGGDRFIRIIQSAVKDYEFSSKLDATE